MIEKSRESCVIFGVLSEKYHSNQSANGGAYVFEVVICAAEGRELIYDKGTSLENFKKYRAPACKKEDGVIDI